MNDQPTVTDLASIMRHAFRPNGTRVWCARDMHRAHKVGRSFATWISERADGIGLVAGTDYWRERAVGEAVSVAWVDRPKGKAGGRNRIEYLLTDSAAWYLLAEFKQGTAFRRWLVDQAPKADGRIGPQ